jgi:hypothetical protein
MDSDYNDFPEFSHDEVSHMLLDCKEFIELMEGIITSTRG